MNDIPLKELEKIRDDLLKDPKADERKIRAITSQITNIVLDTDNIESKIVRQKIAELEETTPKPKKKKSTKIKP